MNDGQVKINRFIDTLKSKFPDIIDGFTFCGPHHKSANNKSYLIFDAPGFVGIDIHLFNFTAKDIKCLVDKSFNEHDNNINHYVSLLQFYNRLLYNCESSFFQLHIGIFEYNDDKYEPFAIKLVNQESGHLNFWFYGYSVFQKINFMGETDGQVTYCLEFDNVSDYDAVRESINRRISRYVSVDDINSKNIVDYSGLISMIKY